MNDKRTIEATLTLADNGYIVSYDGENILLVHEGCSIDDIGKELLSDLEDLIDRGKYGKFRIKVEVEPVNE